MFRVAVTTLGCKVNQCESAGIIEAMTARGMTYVPFEEEADCYIVNTCTVTCSTDGQSRRLIRRTIRRNPAAAIVVTGCYAQRAPEEIASIPGIRIIAGNTEKERLPALIQELAREKGAPFRDSDIGSEKRFSPPGAAVFPKQTRAFLKIQDGCNAFCSYCIVPHVRGRSRSRRPAEVMDSISALATGGYREVVLTGIHLGAYGRDLIPVSSIMEIVKSIVKERPVERLRLSSIEPREITPDLISLIGSSGILCRHLHIPLQSGDDEILALMHRDYNTAFFRNLVQTVCSAVPGIAIGIDIMVGFPGETEEAFANTLGFVEELSVAYFHVFPYSGRPGTPAVNMPGQVPETIKKRRAERLRSIGAEKRRLFAERFIGVPLAVLIEGRKDKSTGFPLGFSDNYIAVACRGAEIVNRIIRTLPVSYSKGRLIAEVIHDAGESL
jgi:threonylcarbamoyladenosine tRNA methylthiotransferase MtaB